MLLQGEYNMLAYFGTYIKSEAQAIGISRKVIFTCFSNFKNHIPKFRFCF